MKKLSDYEQVKTLLGEDVANWWLVYKVGDVYVSNKNIEIDMLDLNYEDKVYYLPFVLDKRLIKIKNVQFNNNS